MAVRRMFGSIAIVLVATACAKSSPQAAGISHPTGANQVVVRVENSGGLINPAVQANQVPEFSLFGDGRTISPGAAPAIYPGPAISEPIVTPVTEPGIQAILDSARQAGLFANHTSNGPGIPDTGTTVITINAQGSTYVSRYMGLSPSGADAKVSAFVGKLQKLASWLPAGSVGTDRPYDPTSVAVTVGPYEPGNGPSQRSVAWPLPTPLSGFGTPVPAAGEDVSCGAVSGGDLTTLLPLVDKSNQLTPWTDAGKSYGLSFRALLPDQAGC